MIFREFWSSTIATTSTCKPVVRSASPSQEGKIGTKCHIIIKLFKRKSTPSLSTPSEIYHMALCLSAPKEFKVPKFRHRKEWAWATNTWLELNNLTIFIICKTRHSKRTWPRRIGQWWPGMHCCPTPDTRMKTPWFRAKTSVLNFRTIGIYVLMNWLNSTTNKFKCCKAIKRHN